jgi:hypothetical protein
MFYLVIITRARVPVFFGVLRYFFFVVSDARKLEKINMIYTQKLYVIIYSYLLVETANGAWISSFSVVVAVVAVRRRSPRSA